MNLGMLLTTENNCYQVDGLSEMADLHESNTCNKQHLYPIF